MCGSSTYQKEVIFYTDILKKGVAISLQETLPLQVPN